MKNFKKEENPSHISAAENTCENACEQTWWKLPLLIALLIAAVYYGRVTASQTLTPAGPSSQNASGSPINPAEANHTGETVSLVIDFNNGVLYRYKNLPYTPEMTVWELMQLAKNQTPSLQTEVKGSGEMTLITKIAGIKNQQAAGPNWVFMVNDQTSTVGSGTYKLSPNDKIRWKFTEYLGDASQ